MTEDSHYTKALIRKLLRDTLTPQELEITKGRAGVDDSLDFSIFNQKYKKMTLKKLGEKLGLTTERIRQIHAKAMRKLRKQICSSPRFQAAHDGDDIEEIVDKELRSFLIYVWYT